MRSTSGYASIWCIFFHQLQPRDSMAPITRGLQNVLSLSVFSLNELTFDIFFYFLALFFGIDNK